MVLEERQVLKDLLSAEKGLAKAYSLAQIEASAPTLRQNFDQLATKIYSLQFKVFNVMHDKGFYPTPKAEQQAITNSINTWRKRVNS